MTTGRINQVRTVGGARPPGCGLAAGPRPTLARPPPPGLALGPLALLRRARSLGPVQAASDTRACLPTPRGSEPRAGPGAELAMRGGPENGRGGAPGWLAGWLLPCLGSRLGAAHLRMGGEEECARTGDTNPGCNYLVRGYSPSMHYFWRGDMPHFSPPLPFQRGRVGCRCVPPNPAASAVVCTLHFGWNGAPGRRRAANPLAGGGRLGTAPAPECGGAGDAPPGSRPTCRRGPAGRSSPSSAGPAPPVSGPAQHSGPPS